MRDGVKYLEGRKGKKNPNKTVRETLGAIQYIKKDKDRQRCGEI